MKKPRHRNVFRPDCLPADRDRAWAECIGRMRLLAGRLALDELRTAGVTLRLDNERLLAGPTEAVDTEAAEKIRKWRDELTQVLRNEEGSSEGVGERFTQGLGLAPSLDGCGTANVIRGKTGADETREAG